MRSFVRVQIEVEEFLYCSTECSFLDRAMVTGTFCRAFNTQIEFDWEKGIPIRFKRCNNCKKNEIERYSDKL